MPTDDLQRVFRLIYCLHPDRAVSLCVLQDAHERISLIQKAQERRPGSPRPFKPKVLDEHLPQLAAYLVSEVWEKDQESENPRMEPKYRPTQDDRLVRYIKALILKAMVRRSCYTAVGLGCLLYCYQPHEISSLSEEYFNSDNIRRVKRQMIVELKNRFRGAKRFQNGNGHIELEIPGSWQKALIQRSLPWLAPWHLCDATARTSTDSLLETFFDRDSEKSEWERSHVLADPTCGGLPRLVHEYNAACGKESDMRLDDPDSKLRSPKFDDDLHAPSDDDDGNGSSDPGGRFDPPPLNHNEISSIKHSFERNQRRRKNYRLGPLRVYVDGEEAGVFKPGASFTPFAISSMALSVEVRGEDAEGELLLAMFPLTCVESAYDLLEQKLQVLHEGGQEISLIISLVPDRDDDVGESLARIEYSETERHNSVGNSDTVAKLSVPYISADTKQSSKVPRAGRDRRASVYALAAKEPDVSFRALLPFILSGGRPIEDLLGHPEFQGQGRRICTWIMRRHQGSMMGYYDAEDLFCEASWRVAKSIHKLHVNNIENEEASFFRWFVVLAHNIVRSKLRKFKIAGGEGETLTQVPIDGLQITDTSQQVEREYLLSEFLEFTETLPEKRRRAIQLWCEGYSNREITALLNGEDIKCSHVTVLRWVKTVLEDFVKNLERNKKGLRKGPQARPGWR